MNLLNINESQIKALSKVGMSLTHFWFLHVIQDAEFSVFQFPQIRERKLLEDRGLVTKNGISAAGIVFYTQISNIELETSKSKKEEKVVSDNGFSDFWKEFPRTATFSYKGMSFKSSRVLRSNEAVCKMEYDKAIAKGVVTPEQMLKVIKYQVQTMKEESFDRGINRFEHMNGCEVWLRQAKYEALIEVMEHEEDEQPTDNCWA